jgi:hypothetical protein
MLASPHFAEIYLPRTPPGLPPPEYPPARPPPPPPAEGAGAADGAGREVIVVGAERMVGVGADIAPCGERVDRPLPAVRWSTSWPGAGCRDKSDVPSPDAAWFREYCLRSGLWPGLPIQPSESGGTESIPDAPGDSSADARDWSYAGKRYCCADAKPPACCVKDLDSHRGEARFQSSSD